MVGLERELKEHKEQAIAARGKYAEYNNELHQKIHAFREEKKGWIMEAAVLRKKEKEAQVSLPRVLTTRLILLTPISGAVSKPKSVVGGSFTGTLHAAVAEERDAAQT